MNSLLPFLAVVANTSVAGREQFPGAEWDYASPESQGIDADKLHRAVAFLKGKSGSDGVDQLVIVRNGVVVWSGAGADEKHGVWSMTKSFTSTVLGLLIEDGRCSLDTKIAVVLPEMADAYPDATLRHFTTMTSGYRAIGDEPRGAYTHGPSATPFDPSSDPLFEPGAKFAYWDSAMNQFANALTRIAGESIETLFKRRIADPIGMRPDAWDWGEFDVDDGSPAINGGSGNGGKHVFTTAREAARLGWLFLNRGNWNGRQLIRSAWVDQATSVQVPASMPRGHEESAFDGRGVYGFNWWRNGFNAYGQRKWPGATAGTFAASGFNNNDLFVVPEWNMVVVRLGLDQRDYQISDSDYGTFLRLLGNSLIGQG